MSRNSHGGWTAGREHYRDVANPSNSKPQSTRMNLNLMTTEVPAQHWVAWSGLDLE